MGDHPGLLRLRPRHRHPLSLPSGKKAITVGLCPRFLFLFPFFFKPYPLTGA
uniref:Uncharacterized protein n=1 Tax=Arundo donax TaxID=35708 RepID=A0A0A9FF58_ARUDO